MKNIIVIDNFYKNPLEVRDYALQKAKYLTGAQVGPEFPGTESVKGFYSPEIIKKIEDAIGKKIEVNPRDYSFGVFSKTFASDEKRRSVHVDASDWTALLYLSRPQDCQGGTVFYEHKGLGWSQIPSLEELQSKGYLSREEFIQGDLKRDSKNFENWKVSSRIGMKFNRLLLFRSGDLFHAAEGYFGDCDLNCRLLQLFFFRTKS